MASSNRFGFNLSGNYDKDENLINEKSINVFLKNLPYGVNDIFEYDVKFTWGDGKITLVDEAPDDPYNDSYHREVSEQLEKLQNDFSIKLQGKFVWYEDDSEGTHIDRYEYAGDGTVKHFYINQEWEDDEPNKDDERWKEIA